MRRVRYVAHMGEKRNTYKVLEIKPEGKRKLRKSRHKCELNIEIDLKKIGWDKE
jgi:hypothetical protein